MGRRWNFILFLLLFFVPARAIAQGGGILFLDKEKYNQIPKKRSILGGAKIPSESDLSDYFPVAGHQGDQPSCVGWTVGYALKTFQEAFERDERYPIQTFSPAYIYNSIKENVDSDNKCGEGSYLIDGLNRLKDHGAVLMTDFPYDDSKCELPSGDNWSSSPKNYRSSNYKTVSSVSAAKRFLSEHLPIVIGINLNSKFEHIGVEEVYKGGGNETVGHAMIMVGHNDEKNAFKVLNSYGSGFGDSGYAWIDYSLFGTAIEEAYVSKDDPTNKTALDLLRNDKVDSDPPLLAGSRIVSTGVWKNEEIYQEVIAGLRGNIVSKEDVVEVTADGLQYFPASMWIDLPESLKKDIKQIQYHFVIGFDGRPLIPQEGSKNAYLITWIGYGGQSWATIRIIMNDGREIDIRYPHQRVWENGILRESDKANTEMYPSKAAFGKRNLPLNCPTGTIPQTNNTCLYPG